MLNAFDIILGAEWAMQREPLECLLEVARTRGGGYDPEHLPDWCSWAEKSREHALGLQQGGKLEGTRRTALRDGVAIVPVLGPIFRRANLMTELSGATSLEMIGRDVATAAASESVKAILLDIDSPGGQAAGVAELAAHLVAMNRKKPVHAYIGGTGASAAYWLAAGCGGITAAPTAIVGSIGVMAAYRRGDEGEVAIVSSQSPKKRPDLDTEEGRADLQRTIDDLAAVFVADVARYRAVSEQTVLREFGQGSVLVGKSAERVGMVDRIGNFEGTLRALAQDAAGLCDRRKRARAEAGLGDPDAGGEAGEYVAAIDGGENPWQATSVVWGAAPAAVTFEDELTALLAGVDRSIARAREIHSRRREDGRSLSASRREQLQAVRDRLDTLLADTTPRAEEAERRWLAMQALALEAAELAASVGR